MRMAWSWMVCLMAVGWTAKGNDAARLGSTEFKQNAQQERPTAIVAQIHPTMPKYSFSLIPDVHEDDPAGRRQHVGRIQISKEGSNEVFQTIDVFMEGSIEFFVRQFEILDINNDGYLDIGTLAEFGGAKWGRWQYWVYDPKSGRFITNWLTRRLSQFRCNEVCSDATSSEIHVHYLRMEGVIDERYKVEGRRLVLAGTMELKPKDKGFTMITKRLIKAKMEVTKVEQTNEYPNCDCTTPRQGGRAVRRE